MPDHDRSYKRLFEHSALVADLLRGFVREPWVDDLDLGTLEPYRGSFTTRRLRAREADCIWRVRFRGEWLYLYLLLEFQSRVDAFMAVRIMAYVGLLYEHLIETQRLKAGVRLPAVLPLVLYNGKRRWDAAQDVGELLPELHEGLARFLPRVRYFLLDEGTFSDSELASVRNLAAALFRLENSRTPADAAVVVKCLVDWLSSPEQARLSDAFRVWLTEVLVPGKLRGQSIEGVRELDEVRSMLEARVKEWTRQWRRDGLKDGRKGGLKDGLKKGRREGKAELLLGQLEIRFGAVTEEFRERVQTAAEPQLTEWGRRLLTEGSLERVFATDSETGPGVPDRTTKTQRRTGRHKSG